MHFATKMLLFVDSFKSYGSEFCSE